MRHTNPNDNRRCERTWTEKIIIDNSFEVKSFNEFLSIYVNKSVYEELTDILISKYGFLDKYVT